MVFLIFGSKQTWDVVITSHNGGEGSWSLNGFAAHYDAVGRMNLPDNERGLMMAGFGRGDSDYTGSGMQKLSFTYDWGILVVQLEGESTDGDVTIPFMFRRSHIDHTDVYIFIAALAGTKSKDVMIAYSYDSGGFYAFKRFSRLNAYD
eukprot:GHVS01050620.1.p1 GENE.GHVS01050620.1~~GHVS01050620.1.p1  ORF type:complete len:148 (-),score=5.20 GHVS01050620.1:49-492(-)